MERKNTDNILIDLASRGDLDAFNELVLLYQDLAYNHARALLDDPALAEDVTQEGFIKAFAAVKNFRGGSFRSWLLTIVTHTVYDTIRRTKKHPTQPLFPEDDDGDEMESPTWLADPGASVQAAVERNEFSHEIQNMLDTLPDAYRAVLTLVDVHELDYAEAARALDVPLGTVKSRLARARLQMKEKLQGLGVFAGATADANVCTVI